MRRVSDFLSRAVPPGLPLWFALLAVGGLALRIALLLQYARSPFGREPLGDERYYWIWAGEIASGRWRPSGVFYQGPLYPYLLAVVKNLAPGFGQVGLAAFQIVVNWLTCLLLVPLVTAWAGRGRALAAATLALLFSPAVFYALKGLPTTLGLFFLVAALAVLCGGREPGVVRVVVGGVLTGLTLLASPGFMTVVPGILAVAALAVRRGRRIAVVTLLALGAALVILPITALNYRQDGSLVLISSSYGMVFAQGNNPRSLGTFTALDGMSTVSGREIEDAERIATREAGRSLDSAEVSRAFFRKGLDFIIGQPGRWLLLEVRKTALLLAGLDVPLEFSLARERRDFLPLLWAFPLSGTVAVLLAVLSLADPALRRAAWRPLLLGSLLAVSCLVFYVSGRYSYPAYFLFLAAVPPHLGALFPPGGWRRLVLPVLAVGGALSFALPFLGDPNWEGNDYLLKLAGVYERQGRPLDALSTYERWLRVSPQSSLLRIKLAEFYLRNGQPEDAETYLREALRLAPGSRTARRLLAQVLVATGRPTDAVPILEELLGWDAYDTRARLLFVDAYEALGKPGEAREEAETAVRLDPLSEKAQRRLAAFRER